MTTWRDLLPVHPAADALPLLSKQALQDLADDIQKNGLLVPLQVVHEGGMDYLIDGRNRLDAMELAGYHFTRYIKSQSQLQYRSRFIGSRPEYLNLESISSRDPAATVISSNLRRRHLPPGELVRYALEIRKAAQPETPPDVAVSVGGRGHKGEASEIAEQLDVPIRTVQRVIAEQRPKLQPEGPTETPSTPRPRHHAEDGDVVTAEAVKEANDAYLAAIQGHIEGILSIEAPPLADPQLHLHRRALVTELGLTLQRWSLPLRGMKARSRTPEYDESVRARGVADRANAARRKARRGAKGGE